MIAALFVCLAPLVGDDLAALDKKLRSSEERERRTAVIELAKLGGADGWTRVLDALKDPSSMVGDEAELQLAKLDVPELVDELCGKRGLFSGDERVALRAAGAVGTLEKSSVSAVKVIPALASKSVDVRRVLRASLERLIVSGRLTSPERATGALDGWMKSNEDAEVRAAGLAALVRIPEQMPPAPSDLARDTDPAPVTCSILRLLAGATDPKARAFVAKCAQSAERSVRAQVVENIASKPDAEGLRVLVGMLEKEPNRRVAWTIDGTLEKLSGLAGGGKVDFWRGWLEKLGSEWKPATGARPSTERVGETSAPKLVGFPVVSSAVAILVDFSGSTWEKRADGKTRKERLDEELAKMLGTLPADTLFNLIPYTSEPIPFEKALVLATPATVQRALKFFTGNKQSGKGNAWSAIELALQDPRVDTILVLTDGAPTGGLRWNIDLMRDHYVERDRFRHVALDAILVDAKKGLQDHWRTWCEATGGRMLAVDLK